MNAHLPKLPIGESSFENLRTRGYLYVDKTRWIHRLVTEGSYYFLARPRRFGKSLLVSTLKSLFEGRRDLFAGLWIDRHGEWEWQEHPVVVLDLNALDASTPDALREDLSAYLSRIAQEWQVAEPQGSIVARFGELIRSLYLKTGRQVAVLIDEYDRPIISHLGRGAEELALAVKNRDILRGFFGVLKAAEVVSALRFVFLTGVSQFSKVSIFSDLNNLNDLSMYSPYADLLGYTQEELEEYFGGHIAELAARLGCSYEAALAELSRWYDGYRFSDRDVRVYNPFSILNALRRGQLESYWFVTGTPAFLVDLLKERRYDPIQMEGLQVSRSLFTTFDVERLLPEALLFQTGYLTIKDVDGRLYTLGYPNQEVKAAFTESLLYAWMEREEGQVSSQVLRLSRCLQDEDLEAFFEAIRAIFGSIPYDIETKRDESYFHTIFYLMMAASGGDVQSSVLTSRGRIDLVVTFADKVYLMEFKCNQSPQAGLRQIWERGYVERYRGSGKRIILLGIDFGTEERNVRSWEAEEVIPERG